MRRFVATQIAHMPECRRTLIAFEGFLFAVLPLVASQIRPIFEQLATDGTDLTLSLMFYPNVGFQQSLEKERF